MAKWGLTEDSDWRTRFLALPQGVGLQYDDLYDDLGPELRELWGVTADIAAEPLKVQKQVAKHLESYIIKIEIASGIDRRKFERSLRVSYHMPGLDEFNGLELKNRQKRLQTLQDGVAPSTGNSYIRMLTAYALPIIERHLLAAGIITADIDLPDAVPVGVVSSPGEAATLDELLASHPRYIKRDTYHAEFRTRIGAGNVVVLGGGRGCGKSRLALELVAEQQPKQGAFLFVRAESLGSAADDIRMGLQGRRTVRPGATVEEIVEIFVELLCASDAPDWVVIDNIEDQKLVEMLLPRNTRSRVIVTSSVALPRHLEATIEVRPMEDESVRLVKQELPYLNEDQAKLLGRDLGGLPLAIVQACAYVLGDHAVSVDDFLRDLANDPSLTLDAPAPFVERTLVAIYNKTLDSFRSGNSLDRLAAALLEACCCMAPHSIHRGMLYERTSHETPLRAVEFQAAILKLESRYLIGRVGQRLTMHPLTGSLLRDMIPIDRRHKICLSLYSEIRSMLTPYVESRLLPFEQTASIVENAGHVFEGLQGVAKHQIRSLDLDGTIVLLLRAFQQTGFNYGVHAVGKLLFPLFNGDADSKDSAGTEEAMITYVEIRYLDGSISSEERLRVIEGALRIGEDAGWQTSHLTLAQILAYASALRDRGRCHDAFEILGAREQEFVNGPALLLAEFYALSGELFTQLGDWEIAAKLLIISLRVYSRPEVEPHEATRGAIRVIDCMVETSLKGNDGGSIAGLVHLLEARAAARPNGFGHLATRARIDYIHGRIRAATYFKYFHKYFGIGGSWDPGKAELVELLEGCLSRLSLAASDYDAALLKRQAGEPYSYAWSVMMLRGAPSFYENLSLLSTLPPSYDLAKCRCMVFAGKMLLIGIGGDRIPSESIVMLEAYAFSFALNLEDAYWYCESLATSCALAALRGDLIAARLKSLREGYEMIHRLDRWEALERALSFLPDDLEGFRREISYLVTI